VSEVAVLAEGLSKRYRIGSGLRYKTLRESLAGLASGVVRPWRRRPPELIWALRDVTFEVKAGEVVGVIGRNGAGKSTLLKVLSRITEPTAGRARIRGRVGSLLEVGTGFHSELTGRENIFLSGAVLGMRRAEIERKFDEIVSFAEVETFIDTPVKHYSSGMYLRLAFAVAAHLEPEILLVDEVLAVGDAAFQKKCLGKMGDVARVGRTILFVSHNIAAVVSLCRRSLLLEQGKLVCEGSTPSVLDRYLGDIAGRAAIPLRDRADRAGDGSVRLTSISVDSGSDGSPIRCGDRLRIRIGYESSRELSQAGFLVGIYDQLNRAIFFLDSQAGGGLAETLPASGAVVCLTGPINLTPGSCIVNVAVQVAGAIADHVTHVHVFDVEPEDFHGTGRLANRQTALVLLPEHWSLDDK
jgi:lipopolysaccharide transport system ATP-binding protein